jgi:predicted amidophosphoribosyltransferase
VIKKDFFGVHNIVFVNYFVEKRDRDQLGEHKLQGSRTLKVLHTKQGIRDYSKEIAGWLRDELSSDRTVLVPFPSTNKFKAKSKQLPFVLVKHLCRMNAKWVDGSGCLRRRYSLPKNTRSIVLQFHSLRCDNTNLLKGQDVTLIDDVVTTGSSIKAGIKVLSLYSPLAVRGLAIAKKVRVREIPLTGIY